MKRPDEELFLQHTEHFQTVDGYLEEFCSKHGFVLDKNLYRTPCRVLRKQGNPELIIDFYQEGNWLNLEYTDGLLHTFAVAGYYEPFANCDYRYKMEKVLIEKEKFGVIVLQLQSYLNTGLKLLDSWTPEKFEVEGIRIENFKKTFNQ